MSRTVALLAAFLILTGARRPADAEGARILSWPQLLDKVQGNDALAGPLEKLIDAASDVATTPIIQRAYDIEDIGKHRTWLDGRSKALEDEIRETFALAMSDYAACNTAARELQLLAAAYRLTREQDYLDRAIKQLEEMASWSPLQRPGWTLYAPGHRLPADGKDGNWLATGVGVRGIGDALDILPEERVPPELRERLNTLFEAELAGVVDDWETKRPWFVSGSNPITNQWVLPTEGLVRACILLGVENHQDAYDLGVRNLLAALDAHGAQGEFEEGFGYASFTVTSMLHAAHAMAVAGDRRAVDHPFLKNFPTWLVHHFQPGNMVINCFDAGGAYDAARRTAPLLSLLATCTSSPAARWALVNCTDGPSNDLAGLAARALPPVGDESAPPLFAYYERATRVNWRDSWDADATGVWVRGGHPLDQHDHQDRGHVNFIAHGRSILIEAGTPAYHHRLLNTHFSSGVGHNVLQLGTKAPVAPEDARPRKPLPGWQKPHGVAPLTVHRLDEQGGEVTFDGSNCYDGLDQWLRTVTWSSEKMTVKDEVVLGEGAENTVLFRWHLGTDADAAIAKNGSAYSISWPDAQMSITSTVPLSITQEQMPDHTLQGHTGEEDPGNVHTCIVVQTKQPANKAETLTEITPTAQEKP